MAFSVLVNISTSIRGEPTPTTPFLPASFWAMMKGRWDGRLLFSIIDLQIQGDLSFFFY